jgi:hypothetical protein
METVRLKRLETSDQGTFGRLEAKGAFFFCGELPWKDNASNESCIPDGRYKAEWTYSERFKRKMYHVYPVKGRAGIRMHAANLMGKNPPFKKQLNGCIALGESLGVIDGQKAVLLSKPAMRRFEALMDYKPFHLIVSWNNKI